MTASPWLANCCARTVSSLSAWPSEALSTTTVRCKQIGQSVAGQPLPGLARHRCVRSAATSRGGSPRDMAHIV